MNNRIVEDNNLQSDMEEELSDIDEVDITNNNNYLILSSLA